MATIIQIDINGAKAFEISHNVKAPQPVKGEKYIFGRMSTKEVTEVLSLSKNMYHFKTSNAEYRIQPNV